MENKELTLKEKEFLKLFDNGYYNNLRAPDEYYISNNFKKINEEETFTDDIDIIREYFKIGNRYFCLVTMTGYINFNYSFTEGFNFFYDTYIYLYEVKKKEVKSIIWETIN